MLKLLKNWTLPVAMTIGVLGYPFIVYISFLMPYLIFLVLLFTFCKISFKDLRFERLHGWLLGIQMVGSILIFIVIYPFNKYIAEGAMLCVIAPTAAAAAVITGKLGGNVPSLTAYTLLSSILTAILVPLFFPVITMLPPNIDIHTNDHFFLSVFLILSHVFPILIGPLILAWFIRKFIPHLQQKMIQAKDAAFYLWGFSLVIVTAVTVKSMIDSEVNALTEILIALAGFVICGIQFYVGKRIGSVYNKRITGGQGLGQKNTILTIWISQTYLNPIAALGPGSYILWQNMVNSWQLWKKQKRDAAAAKKTDIPHSIN